MADLLVTGYTRRIEECLCSKFVPQTIIDICLKFYLVSLPIYYLSEKEYENPNGLYISDINHNQKWKCKIYDLFNNSKQIKSENIIIENSAICCANDVKLPPKIREKIIESYKHYGYILNKKIKKNLISYLEVLHMIHSPQSFHKYN